MRLIKFSLSILPAIIVLSLCCGNDSPTGPVGESYPDSVVATVGIGNRPMDISILPSGDYIYVTNLFDDNVSVIRTFDQTVVATVSVGDSPRGICALPSGICSLPSGDYIYAIANSEAGYIRIIRTSDNSVIETIQIGYYMEPMSICSHPSGESVYVVNRSDNSVSIIQ